MKRFTASEMHRLLAERRYTGDDDAGGESQQALFCPYYEALEGPLGGDWGVILNPESPKFGQLVFEHDRCGCPAPHQSSQETAAWLKGHAQHKWEPIVGRICGTCGEVDPESFRG